MRNIWGRPLGSLIVIGVVALLLWAIAGPVYAAGALIVLLLVALLHHIVNLSHLHRWLRDPRANSLPDGTLEWEEIFAALSRLLRRQTHIESRLSAALDRFQQAGSALPEGIIILGDEEDIRWCNRKAEEFFGLMSQRDRGQQITYFIRSPQFAEYLATRNFSEPLVMRLRRHDHEIILSIQLVPYGDSERLLLSRDVTRWERLETARRDFVANVSHELRTPLTVLRGFLETLSDMHQPDREMLRRSIELMSEQASRMQVLVEDLLTLSKLESAQNPLSEDYVDVPQLARSLSEEAKAMSAGRHRISLRLENGVGLKGNTDELRSALTNMISNAVRYTPDNGEIELGWGVRDEHPIFSVRDTGIGIEPYHIPRLTERFYRVDRSRSRATGGTGLGLAIVKHVLSRHQAALEITSEVGKGSIFTAVFPPHRSASPPQTLIADKSAQKADSEQPH